VIQTAAVIGAGRAGSSLVASLVRTSCRVEFVVDPAPVNLELDCPVYKELHAVSQAVDLLLICVPDRDIPGVLVELARHPVLRHSTVMHLSGASNLSPYKSLEKHSFNGIGMLHPLYSFSQQATALPDELLYGVNGDETGISVARELCEILRGRAIVVKEESGALYHALAVIMSNFPQALATLTAELTGGVTPDPGDRLLLREGLQDLLLQSVTGQSVAEPGAELTGPARRGDMNTMRVHLQELRGRDKNLMDLYLRFSQIVLHLYEEEIPASLFAECRQLLEKYENR